MAEVEIKLGVDLTPKQIEYLPAIMWLINGPGRSGRTTLLAVAYITAALNYGESIVVRDHYTHREADRHLISQIADIIDLTNSRLPKGSKERLVLTVEGDRIRVTGGYDGLEAKWRR